MSKTNGKRSSISGTGQRWIRIEQYCNMSQLRCSIILILISLTVARIKCEENTTTLNESQQLTASLRLKPAFKVHNLHSQVSEKALKLITVGSAGIGKRQAASEPSSSKVTGTSTKDGAQQHQKSGHKSASSKHPKISNTKLKQILNQSILKANNGSLSSLGANYSSGNIAKGSNFKLVFVQRATAPPSSDKTKKTAPQTDPKLNNNTNKPTTAKYQPQQSLAAAVSKQLASSLLYSAANFVGNITSGAPSLTSLVAQSLNAATTLQKSLSTTEAPPSSSSSASNELDSTQNDIKRLSHTSTPTKDTKVSGPKKSSQKNNNSTTKSRPSKIYNLPVKFVSNGQPNSIVLSQIKQHFATIKKLQMAANFSNGPEAGVKTKRRKQQMIKRLKSKGNSRLIYLPLKYLSNARPNRMSIMSKATHKTGAN